jgi:uncharacterized protein (TIGR02266 family)
MDNERRNASRADLFTEVEYEGGGVRAQTRVSDISLTGVFIDALSPLPEGSNIKLSFTLPGGRRVTTEGVVVHRQPAIGMGVAFTGLDPEDARIIQKHLEQK